MEDAAEQLIGLSEISNYGKHRFDSEGLTNAIRGQIQTNLIAQFGLGNLFDSYQSGGGVDTIHNVRTETYSTKAVEADLTKQTSGYNQKQANEFRGGSDNYKNINAKQTALKKAGQLTDPNTGMRMKPNEKTDLDHIKPLQNIYTDKGRALAGISVDEAANTDSNLKLTNSSINRSMGAQDKAIYANDLPRKKEIWKAQREEVLHDKNLSNEKKTAKLQNIDNRMKADADEIKKSAKEAQQSYERQINRSYYTSSKFLKAAGINAGKQAMTQGKKMAIGAIMYQVSDILFDVIVPIIKNWNQFKSMDERIERFKSQSMKEFESLSDRIKTVNSAVISGVGGGFISAILNMAINMFATTGKNIARLLNDLVRTLWQSVKILTSKDQSIPLAIKLKEVVKLVSTALIATGGVVLGEAISESLVGTPFVPLADVIGTSVAAILTGLTTAVLLFLFDHFGETVQEFKQIAQTVAAGVTLSASKIRADYEISLRRIDSLYQDVLESIYNQYAKLNQLADLAFDLELPGAAQFAASQNYADTIGVAHDRVLRSKTDIKSYFNS